MSGSKELKVYEVHASEDANGEYTGQFVIAQDDPNLLEFSDMNQDSLERYDEFMTRRSDGKTFVAKDLLIVSDTRPTTYAESPNVPVESYQQSSQIFGFTCKNFT